MTSASTYLECLLAMKEAKMTMTNGREKIGDRLRSSDSRFRSSVCALVKISDVSTRLSKSEKRGYKSHKLLWYIAVKLKNIMKIAAIFVSALASTSVSYDVVYSKYQQFLFWILNLTCLLLFRMNESINEWIRTLQLPQARLAPTLP